MEVNEKKREIPFGYTGADAFGVIHYLFDHIIAPHLFIYLSVSNMKRCRNRKRANGDDNAIKYNATNRHCVGWC
jgi:hypothetical protein